MQSLEYPDLRFVEPAAWGIGRDGRKVKYVVIHYTAGAERNTSAEDGAAYDQRRTDGTSTHYFHDSDSTIQCVYTWNRGNAARQKGNRLGIQHELCGTQQTRAQWLDPASDGTLWNAAKQTARDCVKYNLPVRRLSVAEVRACWYNDGPGGICGHVDVTNAYPEDQGDHTDPGPQFPWDIFLSRVQIFVDQIKGGRNMTMIVGAITGDASRRAFVGDGTFCRHIKDWNTAVLTLHRAGALMENSTTPVMFPTEKLMRETLGLIDVTDGFPFPITKVTLTPEDRAAIVEELKTALIAALPAQLTLAEVEGAAFNAAQRAEGE